ncbi:MAG TPA: family 43 glycosylhydrolase [Lachnospiraceae bacterium]|nr:family 43 glycosylhydrolase [Lachnospiraceae bacterium]
MIQITNPILSGFYPDPSICRVGEDFYLVNSSFSYFPGVPIWHSKNLANWKQIGNILDRHSQLPLEGCGHSQGIFAPTIRFHNGTYYMITTNVSGGGNFIVTATDPAGPWSEPYFLGEEANGIDPSLFFDEDGSCYYVGTRPNPEGVRYNGDWEIWLQRVDLTTMKLVGESYYLWKGALKEVIWPEGPHLYRKGEYYYLMIAEGGTGPNHAVSVARSKNICGPYVNNPNNPILTHRHLGKDYPVIYVGHGDLVDDTYGNWYMVMLASRKCEGHCGLGRETFLAKVTWEEDWPIVNPGIGKLEDVVELPFEAEEMRQDKEQSFDHFNEQSYDVVMLRNADRNFFEVDNGVVRMQCLPLTMKDLGSPAYLGFRQRGYHYEAKLELGIQSLEENEETGLVILQSNEYHVLFRVKPSDSMDNELVVQVVKCLGGIDHILCETAYKKSEITDETRLTLVMNGHGQQADFTLMKEMEQNTLLTNVPIHEMSIEVAGGFVGNTIGVYASSCGKESENKVNIYQFTIKYK